MPADHLLVPTDFTPAADTAVAYAVALGKASRCAPVLLHVLGKEDHAVARERLDAAAANVRERHGLEAEALVVEGRYMKRIDEVAEDPRFGFMVIATHGIRGLKQNLLGADILKIARKSPVPVVVVQEKSRPGHAGPIVLPQGGHEHFRLLIEATAEIAGHLGTEVHIYAVDRPGEEPAEQTKRNMQAARTAFELAGVPFREVHEEPRVMSVGFARQTLEYAKSVDAGMIAVMAVPTAEYAHIAQADKEALITNKASIPVLLASDRSGAKE